MEENKEIDVLKEELLAKIADNYSSYDFILYLHHNIDKWNQIENKNNTIDRIIKVVCDAHKIEKDELIRSNNHIDYYIRGGVFYAIKTRLSLSYNEISVIFKRNKSYVFKIINDIEALLNMKANSHSSLLKGVIELVDSEINKNNI